jgi:hypothetical protein
MILLSAALIASAEPSTLKAEHFGRTAWIFSTVGHSEFCPPGNVTLDVRTGRYTFTPRASRRVCEDVTLERPVKRGRLTGVALAPIQTAYRRVLQEGFESQHCQDATRAQDIRISNGGTPILVLTTGRATASAPDDLSCWNDAASALHDLLDTTFRSPPDP